MKRTASDAGLEGRADEAFAWEDADPLYALFGDVGTEKVFGPAGELREELLEKYLEKAVVQGVVKKPKDWIELWARMDIPPDRQSEVLAPLMAFILRVRPKGLGRILAELVMGHRTKTKAVQESAQQAYKGQRDESGSLREMMFLLFPKSPCFPNGWKRTGWDWKQWWQMTEKTLGHLDPIAAFDQIGLLLEEIEAQGGGATLVQQAAQWSPERLAKVRAYLCGLADIEDEADLGACLDATLA